MRFPWVSFVPGLLLLAPVSPAAEPKDPAKHQAASPLKVEIRGVLQKVTLNQVDSYSVQLSLPPRRFTRLGSSVGVVLEGKLRDRADKLVGKGVVVSGPVISTFLDRASNLRLVVKARTLEEAKER